MSTAPIDTESSIIQRLVVSPDKAEAVLSLKFTAEDEERMHQLVEKNNAGTITEDEKAEMASYRRIGNFLGILQAQARLQLHATTDDR